MVGLNFGVGIILRPEYGDWLERSRSLYNKHTVPNLDVSLDLLFKLSDNFYFGSELSFLFDSQNLEAQVSIVTSGPQSIYFYCFVPSIFISYNTSRGFQLPIGFLASLGVSGAVSLLEDYLSFSPYISYGGGVLLKGGIEMAFTNRTRISLEIGSRLALLSIFENSMRESIKSEKISGQETELTGSFLSFFLRLSLRLVVKN